MTDQQDFTQVLFAWLAEQPEEWAFHLRVLRDTNRHVGGIALKMHCALDYGLIREQLFVPDYPGPMLRGALDDSRKKILKKIAEAKTDAA